ncbi:MAG: 3-deoxy-8-phosphooctulonate synthase [Pirellulaceae bacterium]
MSGSIAQIADIRCGGDEPLLLIAGPCVIENEAMTLKIAEELKSICARLQVPLVFKASFDKANRTSLNSERGPGIEAGLRILERVHSDVGVPVTTDIHEPHQARPAGDVCQLLQIPAFLARQTDLLVAAAATGRAVNVKKGQFMSPADMKYVVEKLRGSGCKNVLLTERGTFFGYGKLVNDFSGILAMQHLGVPVVFDATHSVQQPGGSEGITLGNREMVAPLARAAVAIGANAVFVETHPDPSTSPSDAANIFPLSEMNGLLESLCAIRGCLDPTHMQTR